MSDIDSRWAWSRVEAMADGSLPSDERERMKAAIASDAELRSAVEHARRLRRALRGLGRSRTPHALQRRLLALAQPSETGSAGHRVTPAERPMLGRARALLRPWLDAAKPSAALAPRTLLLGTAATGIALVVVGSALLLRHDAPREPAAAMTSGDRAAPVDLASLDERAAMPEESRSAMVEERAAMLQRGSSGADRDEPPTSPPPAAALAEEQRAALREFEASMVYVRRSASLAQEEVAAAIGYGLRRAFVRSRDALADRD